MNKIIKKLVAILSLLLILSSVLALTACKEKNTDEYMEEDTVFRIDRVNSSIMGIPVIFLDPDSSIILKKDGTVHISVKVFEGAETILNNLLKNADIGDIDIIPFLEMFVYGYLPGFTLDDIEGSIDLLRKTVGVKLTGLDFDDPQIAAMFNELAETGKVPQTIVIPPGIGIEYNGSYHIEKLKSEYIGDVTAIYVGKHPENGEPFSIMTLTTDQETGKQKLYLKIENVKLSLYAIEGSNN